MQEVSPYGQVIFSNPEDKANVDLVNSYRFRSNSPVKYRKWSPDISQEERFRKKREREDEYVRTLEPEEKPILLIKQKNLYKNCKSPNLIEDPAAHDEFYKVSKNTEIIEDIEEQIHINEELASKKTLVYRPKTEVNEPATLKDIYKIQGIEFLPEGFLELEPLLLKDDYEFDSKVHEELFTEEQRKIKAQRRKQYAQKDYQKKREVTIFVVDQYKDRLIEYLDQWYAANKRKMTPDELDYISKVLNADPESLGKLQDMYLHRKKVLNSKTLHGHLYPEGKLKDERFDTLPDNLKKLFVTRPADAYNNIAPKVYKVNVPYDPVYLKKHLEKRSKKKNKKGNQNKTAKIAKDPVNPNTVSNDQGFLKFADSFEDILNGGSYNPYQKSQVVVAANNQETQRLKKTVEYDDELKSYFDNEINVILNKIKNFQPRENVPSEVRFESSTVDNKQLIEQYKEKMGEIPQRELTSSEIIRMDSQLKKYNENPAEYRQVARANLINNPNDFGFNMKNSSVFANKAKVSMLGENANGTAVHKDSLNGQDPENNESVNKLILSNSHNHNDERHVQDTIEPNRITIVSRNDKGASVVSQKLRPSLIMNEYYFQTIDDVIEQNGMRKASILTRNDKGEIIADQKLRIDDIGNFYTSYVTYEPKQGRTCIIVRNERGETISVTPIKTSNPGNGEHFEAVIQRNGARRSTIRSSLIDGEIHRSHKIRPTLIGSEYYTQLVDEVIEGNSKKKLTITTVNEHGDIVTVSRANPNLMGDNYYTEIASDIVDENGQRRVVLCTKNNKNDSVIQQTFTTSLAGVLAEQHYTQMLEEIEDQQGNRKVTMAQRNARGFTEVSQQVRPSLLGENYYIEIVEDLVDSLGNRKITLAAKDNKGDVIIEKIYAPDSSELIGEKYYTDLTNELNKEIKALNESKVISQIRPDNLEVSLEFYESYTKEGDSQVVVAAKNQNGAVVLEKAYNITESAILGDNYYDAVINDIEDELANRKRDSIIRRNTSKIRNTSNLRTSKLSQINEEDEKRSVSKTGQEIEKFQESLFESAISNHEKHLLLSQAVSTHVPRLSKVRDSYYRDMLNDLNHSKNSESKDHRQSEQITPKKQSEQRSKANTLKSSYTEILQQSMTKTIKTSSVTEGRIKASTVAEKKSKNSTATVQTPKQSVTEKRASQASRFTKRATVDNNKNSARTSTAKDKNSVVSNTPIVIERDERTSSVISLGQKQSIQESSIPRETEFFDPEQASRKGTDARQTEFFEPEEVSRKGTEARQTEYYEPEANHKSSVIPSLDSAPQEQSQVDGQLNIAVDENGLQINDQHIPEEQIKEEFGKIFDEHKEQIGEERIQELESAIRNKAEGNLIEQFYDFCLSELPNDEAYKESKSQISLFQYFLEKKQIINH